MPAAQSSSSRSTRHATRASSAPSAAALTNGALAEDALAKEGSTRPPSAVRQRSVFSLAWPSLAENVLLLFMGMASLMMVGRLGPAAVAGVGAANQVANLLVVMFSGLAVGNTSLVARAVGAGRGET